VSRYYASIRGTGKTEATRRGFHSIESHTRSWSCGVRVVIKPDSQDPKNDIIEIYKTSGSSGGNHDILLLTLKELST